MANENKGAAGMPAPGTAPAQAEKAAPVKKGPSPETKEKMRKAQEARTQAIKTLVAFAKDKGGDAEKAAAELLDKPAKSSTPRVSVQSTLLEMFSGDVQSVKGIDIYKAMSLGKGDVRYHITQQIKNKYGTDKASEIVWAQYDEAKDLWTVAGRGAKVPEGWSGHIPAGAV